VTAVRSTLVLGGAASGKSAYAEDLIRQSGRRPVYIATAQAFDDEMKTKIADHRARRGADWTTIEEPLALSDALGDADAADAVILVDCLTLWLSNLMAAESDIWAAIDSLIAALGRVQGEVVLVANEVGLGIVPDNAMAREFRNRHGVLNQAVAAAADRVVFVAAGLPMVLKGDPA
jgi:adenosylcobinamide kinase/adenosylcobinamide-phosphate guanylyltransferase